MSDPASAEGGTNMDAMTEVDAAADERTAIGLVLDQGTYRMEPVPQQVVMLCLDYRVVLRLGDAAGCEVAIETSARLTPSGEPDLLLDPGRLEDQAPFLRLNRQSVTGLVMASDGRLDVDFASGDRLTVEPHPDYEAWTFVAGAARAVALPGGGLAVWD